MGWLPDGSTYEAVREAFRWAVPNRFNIATDGVTRQARLKPDATAVILAPPNGAEERWTFGMLEDRSNRIANVLRARGVRWGDRVALLLPQAPDTVAVHLAVYKLGAVAVPLAMLFGSDAIEHRLRNSGARALVLTGYSVPTIASLRDRLPDLETVLSLDGASDGVDDLDALVDRAASTFEAEATSPEDPAMMIYTSGTTGAPKGALHGHRVLLGHLPGVSMTHPRYGSPGDVFWTPSDWAWAGGLLNALLPALHAGMPVVATGFHKFDPDYAWRLIARHGVTACFMPPTALRLMRATEPNGVAGTRLRAIACGGEAVGEGLKTWGIEALRLPVNELYGQTECNLVLESAHHLGVWKTSAIGKPVPGHTVAVIDEHGQPLPIGETGTIAIARPDPVMFLGYWQDAAATEAKFAGDWMKTGDQGFVDEDGYVHFLGRDDDVITSAGYRIGPAEIEDCLAAHPAVKLAAAVGKPDPVRTEIVKAFVVLNEGLNPSDSLKSELQAWVRQRLSAHEYPREVEFTADLPLTTTGKVIRRLLRART
ncbi:MAG: AMP-binding protein [Hyphomicrobiales bacterium]